MDLSTLTNDELRLRLDCLIRLERGSTAMLLRHLAEVDSRRASDEWGFPSLYVYCTKELRMSEGAAYRRIYAARAANAHPMIYALLEAGELSLESVVLLRPYLTQASASALLAQARGKTKREVELLVRTFDPRPDIRDSHMRLPAPDLAEPTAPLPPPVAAAPPPHLQAPPDKVEPLSPERMHIGFTADCALWQKLTRIRNLLRHKHPRGRLEEVVDEIAEAFLEMRDPERCALRRLARRRGPKGGKRRLKADRSDSPRDSRRVPQEVKDAVWLRDEGRCAYVAKDGRRCSERGGLEYDHLIPWALGGRSDDVSNIRLLCMAHNQHEARETFGADRVGPRAG